MANEPNSERADKVLLKSPINNTQKLSRAEKTKKVQDAIRAQWRTQSDRDIAGNLHVSPSTVGTHRKLLEESGEIVPRIESGQGIEACLREVSISAVEPSPENDKLYEPIRQDDPAFLSFVDNIRVNRILDPIVVSADGYIISGHRRYAAAKYLGLKRIPIRIMPNVARSQDPQKFIQMLASFNKQRVKTTAEAVREGIVGMEDDAWQAVRHYRREESAIDGVKAIELVGEKKRAEIIQKLSLKKAISDTVFQNRKDWPLSDRRIFYLLLNIPGLLRNDVRKTPFENNPDCYNDVTNMVTRMRLDGSIPFDCIADETRPVIEWDTHKSVGTFVDKELENLFSGYWRDLLQSQPNHIELLVEKNTVATLLKQTAEKYTIPMTSGRGYSSLPPRKAMVDRFRESGREKLIVIVVSDFDPEGQDIPNAFGLSLRDDFDIDPDRLAIVKAALTHEQVLNMDIHEGQWAKEDSSRYKLFVEKYGERCWELEAIPSDTLRDIVEDTIRSVLDLESFEYEFEKQRKDQFELDQHRQRIKKLLRNGAINLN
jgi:hypothetical protein